MKKLITILLIVMSGCRQVDVQLPNGNTVKYINFLNNTKIGRMEIIAPTGEKLVLENLDSESKALDVAQKALDKVP